MAIANINALAKLEIYAGPSQALPGEEELFTSDITSPPKDGVFAPVPAMVSF